MREFTHFDERGRARMVDVSQKNLTVREATARGRVLMAPETLELIKTKGIQKGDVLAVAQVAGIMAAKRTHELIPMCHPLRLTAVDVGLTINEQSSAVEIESTVKAHDRTGVEMEALVAVAVAALTIYDMCKAVDRMITLTDIRLVKKAGGKSGNFVREGEQ